MAVPEPAVRRIVPPRRHIVHATDLGGVSVLKHGDLCLLTDPFGDIHPDSRGLGLYAGDTRVLSCSVLTVDGARPALLRGDTDENFRGTIQLTNAEIRRDPGDKVTPERSLARQSLGITRHRILGGALRERLVVANFTEHPETLPIELAVGADAADIFEVRGYDRSETATTLPVVVGRDRAAFGHIGRDDVLRRTQIAFSPADVLAAADVPDARRVPGAAVVLRWRLEVAAGSRIELEWTVWADESPVATEPGATPPSEPTIGRATRPGSTRRTGRGLPRLARRTATIATDNELFDRLIGRSVADLRLLLNDGPGPKEHYLAAGVPWFVTLFGRDALISAYEAVAFRPQLAIETLEVLAARQATRDDPTADAEPGKILHELRTGEMARSGELPFAAYYGSVDATPLWLILLGETFDWTGDDALVERLWPNALAALDWIDRYGDADGDGLPETRTTTIERTLGQETAPGYRIDWSATTILGGDACRRRSEIVCVTAGAAWDAAANLVTDTLTYALGRFNDRQRRVRPPDRKPRSPPSAEGPACSTRGTTLEVSPLALCYRTLTGTTFVFYRATRSVKC